MASRSVCIAIRSALGNCVLLVCGPVVAPHEIEGGRRADGTPAKANLQQKPQHRPAAPGQSGGWGIHYGKHLVLFSPAALGVAGILYIAFAHDMPAAREYS
jgi:hypothetical protein